MVRSYRPLSVSLSAAIVASTLLLSSLVPAQACPLSDGSTSPGNTSRDPNASDTPSDIARLTDESNRRSSLDYMSVAGLGAFAGLFAIALLREVRRSRSVEPAEADFWNRYPQLEHPELSLTLIPKEALPSTFDTEVRSVR